MKVLTATIRTQGDRSTDFSFTVAGELVYLGMVCDADERDPDSADACGCGRAFVGCNSHKATTTAEVVDLELEWSDVAIAVGSSLHQGGWTAQEEAALVQEIVEEMLEIAENLSGGRGAQASA